MGPSVDRQRLNKARPHRGRDDEETIELAIVGGEPGEGTCYTRLPLTLLIGSQRGFCPDPLGDSVADAMPVRFSVTSCVDVPVPTSDHPTSFSRQIRPRHDSDRSAITIRVTTPRNSHVTSHTRSAGGLYRMDTLVLMLMLMLRRMPEFALRAIDVTASVKADSLMHN
jgi:hypothetical protein